MIAPSPSDFQSALSMVSFDNIIADAQTEISIWPAGSVKNG
jgi:hypothetical protein